MYTIFEKYNFVNFFSHRIVICTVTEISGLLRRVKFVQDKFALRTIRKSKKVLLGFQVPPIMIDEHSLKSSLLLCHCILCCKICFKMLSPMIS
jgi:hypothetical protein